MDIRTVPASEGSFFICSDGVYKFLANSYIRRSMRAPGNSEEMISQKVEAAGAPDNYTYTQIRRVQNVEQSRKKVFRQPLLRPRESLNFRACSVK